MSNIQKIQEDLQFLKDDITAYGAGLLDDTAQLGTDLKEQMAKKISDTTRKLKDINDDIKDRTIILIKEADRTVKNKPYHTAGVALIVGMCIGVLIGSKK